MPCGPWGCAQHGSAGSVCRRPSHHHCAGRSVHQLGVCVVLKPPSMGRVLNVSSGFPSPCHVNKLCNISSDFKRPYRRADACSDGRLCCFSLPSNLPASLVHPAMCLSAIYLVVLARTCFCQSSSESKSLVCRTGNTVLPGMLPQWG